MDHRSNVGKNSEINGLILLICEVVFLVNDNVSSWLTMITGVVRKNRNRNSTKLTAIHLKYHWAVSMFRFSQKISDGAGAYARSQFRYVPGLKWRITC